MGRIVSLVALIIVYFGGPDIRDQETAIVEGIVAVVGMVAAVYAVWRRTFQAGVISLVVLASRGTSVRHSLLLILMRIGRMPVLQSL